MADLFCLPEICLLADVIQCFMDSAHDFSPDYVYRDVFRAIEVTHTSGKLHDAITAQPSKYLEPNPQIRELLDKLRKGGKKVGAAAHSRRRPVAPPRMRSPLISCGVRRATLCGVPDLPADELVVQLRRRGHALHARLSAASCKVRSWAVDRSGKRRCCRCVLRIARLLVIARVLLALG